MKHETQGWAIKNLNGIFCTDLDGHIILWPTRAKAIAASYWDHFDDLYKNDPPGSITRPAYPPVERVRVTVESVE